MNSLKGFGVLVLLAGIVIAVSYAAKVDRIVLAATIGIIVTSTATYVASRKRYRKDRRIAGGPDATMILSGIPGSRRASVSGGPASRRRRRMSLALLLSVTAFVTVGSVYPLSHLAGAQRAGRARPVTVSLTVRYRTDTPSVASVGKPWLEVINTSAGPVSLHSVKLRYYFNGDKATPYGANCFQTALRCSNITETIDAPTGTAPGASRYLEVGFTTNTGVLAPGQTTQGIGLQLFRLDHRQLDQTNDHSFDGKLSHYAPSRRVTAYVDGSLCWGDEPGPADSAAPDGTRVPPRSAVPAPAAGVVFDSFHYSGPRDPALAAHGWQVRTEGGGPGIHSTWAADGISFPPDATAKGGQVLQLQVRTDGTKQGTRQAELRSTDAVVFKGTLAARVFFTDEPVGGRNGDHLNESMYTISPTRSSSKYSELDFEYQPNGGWGVPGPKLDTTSWRSAKEGDRATHALVEHLAGWHVLMVTAVDGVVVYSIDGRKIFSSGGKSFPRERMQIGLSAWLVDLPFAGPRTWEMRVNWLYYRPDQALSLDAVQIAVNDLYAGGVNYSH